MSDIMNIQGPDGTPGFAQLAAQQALSQAKSRDVESLTAGNGLGKKDEDAAKQLEELFVNLLVKEMRKTLDDGFFGSGPAASTYEGFFDQALSQSLVQGEGTGLHQAIMESWSLQNGAVKPSELKKGASS